MELFRIKPIAAIPNCSASFNASSVGADFDKTTAQPIFATFSSISQEILPLKTMTLSSIGIGDYMP
jgi:hypothetical protein